MNFLTWWAISEMIDDDEEDENLEEQLLGGALYLSDVEPIDFICSKCRHSSDKHLKGNCDNGVFRKCDCRMFNLDQSQLDQAKKELQIIEDRLLKNFDQVKKLVNMH